MLTLHILFILQTAGLMGGAFIVEDNYESGSRRQLIESDSTGTSSG